MGFCVVDSLRLLFFGVRISREEMLEDTEVLDLSIKFGVFGSLTGKPSMFLDFLVEKIEGSMFSESSKDESVGFSGV